MHLLDGTMESPLKKLTMSVSGGDIKLRRKNPVSTRPLKLRLGSRSGSSHQRQPSNGEGQPPVLSGRPDHPSTNDASNANFSSAFGSSSYLSDNSERGHSGDGVKKSYGGAGNGRPLIHHQRHNLKTRFQLLRTLGEGTYGKVKLASDRSTGEQVAIKYIKKTKIHEEGDLLRIRREIQILSSLRHRHIVNIREVFEKKDKIVLVMDYAQGGELYDYLNKLGRLEEWEARRIFRQMVSAVHYCHQNGIVHRDLKLENIILDDEGNVKIADFGLANYYSHNSTLRTFCGSPLYASPEIVNGKPYHGPEVDVWSLGVILYTLVYGAMPFESNNLVSLKQQISEGDYKQPDKPSDAAGLIRHMLTVTASRRATMTDALHHWWVNFGHSQMPNDQPYSPEDDDTPGLPEDPVTVIHTRNQSSISSDSDVELDFRPSRWAASTVRSRRLDSTGNSLSSSVAGSPAPTPDSLLAGQEDAASIASGLLKLPPEVLDILKGCNSKSLAALLNTDKISTGFDLDYPSSEAHQSVLVSPMCQSEETVKEEKPLSPSVFDSERKPKRSILKRKGKFSGGDSGCMVHEEMTSARSEDGHIPKSGHLPRRLPSFRDEAHGIFASKHRASQLLEAASTCGSNLAGSSVISQGDWYREPPDTDSSTIMPSPPPAIPSLPCPPATAAVCHNQPMQIQQHFEPPPQGIPTSCLTSPPNYDDSDVRNVFKVPSNVDCDNAMLPPSIPPGAFTSSSPHSAPPDVDSAYSMKEPSKVVRRPKGILRSSKLSQMEEARNRLSISSIGSNSSADILDLSYESGDSDHYVALAGSESPDPMTPADVRQVDLMSHGELSPSHRLGEPQRDPETALATDFQNLQMTPGQTLSEEGREIWDSKSSLLYRLTRDAQSLL